MCNSEMSMKEWADKVVEVHKNWMELEDYSRGLRLCGVLSKVQIFNGIRELAEELEVLLNVRDDEPGSTPETFFEYKGVEFFSLGDFR